MLKIDALRIVQQDFLLSVPAARIETGDIVAVIGPSGGGKSTLLAAVAGFVTPASGRIHWNGSDLAGLSPAERPLAVIFQDNNLFPHLSAFDNVALGIRPGLRLDGHDAARARGALARVGLGGLGARRPSELSGGQQGRVALARVLVQDRPLWLLDEPFAALGPALRREMLALVREVAGEAGATVLLVTHQPDDANAVAGKVMVVANGTASEPAETRQVLENPPPALAEYLGR